MNKFLFKSTYADLQKLLQLTETIQKNVMYLTHQVDFIRKKIVQQEIDKALEKTTSSYYDDQDQITLEGFSHHEEIPDK